jgi:ribosomal-protein-alanine N-acetyltransferase
MRTTIYSERLDLVPLNPALLRAMLEHDLAEARRILGVPIPEGLLDSTDVLSLRLKQLELDPTLQPWSLRAMVLREGGVMVGHIGFHTAPGEEYLRPYAPGGVEFGFTVYPPFLRQGYAREASKALMHWAHQNHGVTSFVLSIRPDNAASQALAAELGFERIGSHIDEVDGVEDILGHRFCNDDGAKACAEANPEPHRTLVKASHRARK